MKICLLFMLVLVLFLQMPQTCWPAKQAKRTKRTQQTKQVPDPLKMKALAIVLAGTKAGYELAEDLSAGGTLRNGAMGAQKLSLNADTEYIIAGVCDDNCKDLDFLLFDESNNIVGRDTKVDNSPVVRIIPKRSATFTLGIQMASCTTSKCSLGVFVMKK